MNYYLGFDTETGTLDPATGDVLTAYFSILDENFTILEDMDLKLKPDDRLPIAESGALAVNGIDLEKHLNDPETITYSQAKPKIIALVKKYLKKNGRYSNIIPFGYNVEFDVGYVQYHIIPKGEWESMIHYKALDVMKQVDTLKFHGWLPPFLGNLLSVVKFFGVPIGEAHVAKEDIIMTVGCLKKISELMANKKEGGTTNDLIALLEA